MSTAAGTNTAVPATAAATNGTAGDATFGAYGLLDAESANLLGTYASEQAALRVVAGLAHRYGPASPAVASLVLYRNDVPEDESAMAEGADLVRRALTLEEASEKVSQAPPGSSSRNGSGRGTAAAEATSQRSTRR